MRRTRIGLLMAGALVLAGPFLPAPDPSVAVETPGEPVTIAIDGTSDIMIRQSTPWLDAFGESQTTISYQATSSAFSREHLLTGKAEAAIVGSPYTEEERKGSKVSGTIEVPIHVSAAALLLTEPTDGFISFKAVSPDENPICDPQGNSYEPDTCEVRTRYTGPIRVPHRNLTAMMLKVSHEGLNTWRHKDVRAAFGAPDLTAGGPLNAPTFVHRQPGESVNRHLQQYMVTAAPDVWELAKQASPEAPFAVGERISVPAPVTRSSPSGQAQTVADFQNNPATGGSSDTSAWAGNMTAIPPAAVAEAKETFVATKEVAAPPFRTVEIRNGADQWVEPTPDSISKAVAAGGAKPLYALENRVEGAYPLVWIDQLSAPAKGLSPEKANAVASFVRYVATQGQAGAAALGEGRLSPALVTEALRGADAIVKSNCAGDGVRAASVTDPGPYAPASLKDAGIGEMLLCERTKPAEQPAAAPAPEPGTPSDVPEAEPEEEPFDSGAEQALPEAQDEEPEMDVPELSQEAPPGARRPKAAPKVKLPYAVLAASSTGVDRLTTILLGAGLLLLGRATLWPRLRKRLG